MVMTMTEPLKEKIISKIKIDLDERYKVLILCGKAGCGKSSLKDQLLSTYENIFHNVITCTTRPKREGEENGIDYYFITEDEFKKQKLIESCSFNNWYYGTPLTSLEKDKINLLVLNPTGIQKVKNNLNIDSKVIYLEVDDKERLIRQLNREKDPNVDEIVRRYTTDKNDFQNINEFYDCVLNNNNTSEQFYNKMFLANLAIDWDDFKVTEDLEVLKQFFYYNFGQ